MGADGMQDSSKRDAGGAGRGDVGPSRTDGTRADARRDESARGEDSTYELAPEEPTPAPARASAGAGAGTGAAGSRGAAASGADTRGRGPAEAKTRTQATARTTAKAIEPASVDEDEIDGREGSAGSGRDGDDHEDEDDDGSLPPPISRAPGVRVWLVVASAAIAVLAISWLAGAPQLALPVGSGDESYVPELGIGDRLVGLARTLVYLPLATLGATFGFLALAFVRQRPVGHLGALVAKSSAIVAIGMLVWLVPSEIRFVKQVLNTVVVPVVAGACAVPVLRLSPRDAGLATAFGLMGMLFLVLASAVVVWAVGA